MQMIGHEYIRMYGHPVNPAGIAQMTKKSKEIVFIKKNRLTIISPLDKVMHLIRHNKTRQTRHLLFVQVASTHEILL
jgi:hypothetical protein